jgi:hypothetical protein
MSKENKIKYVYIIWEKDGYDGSQIAHVYSSKERAEEELKKGEYYSNIDIWDIEN